MEIFVKANCATKEKQGIDEPSMGNIELMLITFKLVTNWIKFSPLFLLYQVGSCVGVGM